MKDRNAITILIYEKAVENRFYYLSTGNNDSKIKANAYIELLLDIDNTISWENMINKKALSYMERKEAK